MSSRPPLVDELGLEPHPEGGWYRRTWASDVEVTLPDGRVRPTATSILFLLPAGESSAWHRVASDELWFAQRGRVTIALGGTGERPVESGSVVVGVDPAPGVVLQGRVPAGTWQRTMPSADDALVSCVVSPGFDFDDFALEDDR